MPDRIVRANILDSDKVNGLSWAGEVFYRRLMSIADDYGRYEARASMLRSYLYPTKVDKVSVPDVDKWLAECVKADLVRVYQVDGKQYLQIENFGQRLRIMKSKFPDPPADTCQQMPADDSSRQHQRTSDARNETNRNESESETEKKGNEKEADAPAPAPPSPPSPSRSGKTEEKKQAMLQRRKEFHDQVMAFREHYTEEMLTAFYTYWTEPNKSESRMHFELETTWKLSSRLSTWEKREHQYKSRGGSGGAPPADKHVTAEEVEYLYQRFLEGAKLKEIAKEKHCDFLLQFGAIELEERFVQAAALWRAKQLVGTNNAAELRMIQAYEAGTWPADPDCRTDEPNRIRIAKKLALIDHFQKAKSLNLKTITNAKPQNEDPDRD